MHSPSKKDSRRSFIKTVFWSLPSIGLVACDRRSSYKVGSDATSREEEVGASEYVPVTLSVREWAFVMAACDRLIPPDSYGSGAVEAGVPEYIDRQMSTSYARGELWYLQGPFRQGSAEFGYQLRLTPRDILRLGIENVNSLCVSQHKQEFHELGFIQQDAMLSDLERGKHQLKDLPAETFFSFILQITREGFFSDPVHGGNKDMVGWKLIGFPGARADFMDFVNQEGSKYPLPPVSLQSVGL